jgi:hypothetical protein
MLLTTKVMTSIYGKVNKRRRAGISLAIDRACAARVYTIEIRSVAPRRDNEQEREGLLVN